MCFWLQTRLKERLALLVVRNCTAVRLISLSGRPLLGDDPSDPVSFLISSAIHFLGGICYPLIIVDIMSCHLPLTRWKFRVEMNKKRSRGGEGVERRKRWSGSSSSGCICTETITYVKLFSESRSVQHLLIIIADRQDITNAFLHAEYEKIIRWDLVETICYQMDPVAHHRRHSQIQNEIFMYIRLSSHKLLTLTKLA